MSAHEPSSLPPDLHERLREEPVPERANLEALWERLGSLRRDDEVPETGAAWQALQERLAERPSDHSADRSAPSTRPAPKGSTNHQADRAPADRAPQPAREGEGAVRSSHRWAGPWTVAAVLLVLVLGGVWAWSLPVTVTAPPGERQTATLPDGSTVQLNSESSLSYARTFRAWPFVDAETRGVQLDGEAFFDVRDGERPFVVETADARVRVLGTQFNVRADREAQAGTRVTVSSGRVRVASVRNAGAAVVLDTPGQSSSVANATARPSRPEPVDLERALVWRDGGFAVTDRPLTDIVRELERRYGVQIRIDASVQNPSAPLSLYYPTATGVETIVSDLCTARGLNYRPTSRGLLIYDP
jgi:ferric-dicitrate binding protein FerR (iron transport regulator)